MIEAGQFREDLLYRLNLIAVHLPPLRERRGDIPLLATRTLHSLATIYRRSSLRIQDEGMDWLVAQSWPGNVRQLKHLIERTVLLAPHGILTVEDFVLAGRPETSDRMAAQALEPGSMTLEEMEKEMIARALERYMGNLSRVAKALGLSRGALYRRLEKYGITS
jgi:two-component system NtrC family response regulator